MLDRDSSLLKQLLGGRWNSILLLNPNLNELYFLELCISPHSGGNYTFHSKRGLSSEGSGVPYRLSVLDALRSFTNCAHARSVLSGPVLYEQNSVYIIFLSAFLLPCPPLTPNLYNPRPNFVTSRVKTQHFSLSKAVPPP